MRLTKFGFAALILILLAILARFAGPRGSTIAQTAESPAPVASHP